MDELSLKHFKGFERENVHKLKEVSGEAGAGFADKELAEGK